MFLPENIDFAFSEKYDLSIRLKPNGFSFVIYCQNDPDIFYYKENNFGNRFSYNESIKKLIFDFTFFSNPFRKVTVAVTSNEFTLVPDAFFERKWAEKYFHFNVNHENMHILSQHIASVNGNVVFGIEEELHNFLSRNLCNPVFAHSIVPLIERFSKHNPSTSHKRCFLDWFENHLTIVCFEHETLLSANQFECRQPLDALYLIVGIWEKLEIDQLNDTLYLTPFFAKETEATDMLKQLIRNIEIIDFRPKATLSELDRQTLPTDLLLPLCE